MRVVFRADSSREIGSGHVMRCMALADELSRRGAECSFVSRVREGSMAGLLRQAGYDVAELRDDEGAEEAVGGGADAAPLAHAGWLGCSWQQDAAQTLDLLTRQPPDWLVVDHYALDYRWQQAVRMQAGRLLVIDDLADRRHDCDLLLDQNYYGDMYTRYDGLTPPQCRRLLGPGYVMLRQEFVVARRGLRHRDGRIRRILVFFGGSDPTNQTANVLKAWRRVRREGVALDVVIGAANPHRAEIEQLCGSLPDVALHCQVSNMAELIAAADLGIGAGGVAMWERCYLGLPSITVAFADNQVRTTEDVANLGAIVYLGRCNGFSDDEYVQAISGILDNAGQLKRMSELSVELVKSGAETVANILLGEEV